jgi:glycine hydroxymethyltransferase
VNDLDLVRWEQLRNELHSQRMMGMALDAGGHLTHGFRPNISGKLFDQASYGVDPTSGLLDYGAIAAQVRQFRPLVLVAGYSAYPRNPNFAILAEIAHDVGATFMVDMAHFAGLVAGKVLVRPPTARFLRIAAWRSWSSRSSFIPRTAARVSPVFVRAGWTQPWPR